MGCFLACFGSSKDQKRRKNNTHIVPPQNNNPNCGNQYEPIREPFVVAKQNNVEKPINLVPESRVVKPEEEQVSLNNQSLSNQTKLEEQLSSCTRKKVTFDSNVREYEHVSADEEPECIQNTENEKGDERGVNEDCTQPGKTSSVSESGSTLSSLGSYPPNHRYQNCRESDEEDEELNCEVSDIDEGEELDCEVSDIDEDEEEVLDNEYCDDDDDDFNQRHVPELSAGSCSSMESRTRSPMTRIVNDAHHDPLSDHLMPEIESKTPVFNRSVRDRAGYVHAVLNPVENTTHWKALKARGIPQLKKQKENLQMDPSFKQFTVKCRSNLDEPKNKHEVAVDASLSTWLVSSQKTPPNKAKPVSLEPISSGASLSSHGSNSVRSQEERPILGALTVEELKQFSASSSPRRSPSRSPDEKALVGTVGVHWNDKSPTEDPGTVSSFKGIPNTTSKYREDKRVNWHSTPFETRLERALNKGAA